MEYWKLKDESFAVVRIVHYNRDMLYHDYIAKRPCEVSMTM